MDLKVDLAKILDEIDRRLYSVEQIATSPAVMGGQQTNEFDSIIVDGIILDTTPPGEPTELAVTTGVFYDAIYADAEWVAPAAGSTPDVYELELSRRTSIDPLVYDLERVDVTVGTNFRFEPLRPNSTYQLRVRARSALGIYGPWTPYVVFSTGADTTIPSAPTNVVLARGATSVMVKWDEVADVDVARAEGVYEVQIDTTTAFNSANLQTVRTAATIVAFNNLTTQTTYYARVRSIDASGNVSVWSANSSVFAGGVVESMIVGDFSAAKITYGSMSGDRIQANSLDVNSLKTSTLTSREITIGSGGAFKIGNPPTNGIFINNQGIRAYKASAQTFSLDSSGTATFSGTLNAATGTFSGSLAAGVSIQSPYIEGGTITATTMQSSNYNGSTTGWKLHSNGSAELYTLTTYSLTIQNNGTLVMYGTNTVNLTGTYLSFQTGAGTATFAYNRVQLTNGALIDVSGNFRTNGYLQADTIYAADNLAINIRHRINTQGMYGSSAGGSDVRRYTSGTYELFYGTSSTEMKTLIRRSSPVKKEYAGKVLQVDLPIWNALTEKQVKSRSGKHAVVASRGPIDRGTHHDRMGPIVEDMVEVFPEAVLFDNDGKPFSIDEQLVKYATLEALILLVNELKSAKILSESWPN